MKYHVVLATRNEDKVREIRVLLDGLGLSLGTLSQFPGAPEVVEDGKTLEENALKKATTIANHTGCMAIADDTGLEVEYLNGEPGVFTGRYSGAGASYTDNVNKLLRELKDVPWEKRSARFRCVVAVADGHLTHTVEGACTGVICEEARGASGFGYDPIFYVPEYDRTFAEMDVTQKNRISHRAMAFMGLRKMIDEGEIEWPGNVIDSTTGRSAAR